VSFCSNSEEIVIFLTEKRLNKFCQNHGIVEESLTLTSTQLSGITSGTNPAPVDFRGDFEK